MLAQHEPFPAIVMDRGWTVLRANQGAGLLFGSLFSPEPVPDHANVLRMMIEPGPVRSAVRNWADVVPALLDRARREAVGGVFDQATAGLVADSCAPARTSSPLSSRSPGPPSVPVLDVQLERGGRRWSSSSQWCRPSVRRWT